jgi:lipopolysaccharide transport system permease protein
MNRIVGAVKDIVAGVLSHRVWLMFGWLDIKLRYRRSLLGPFWITLSVSVMVLTMGFLYSQILNQEIQDYLPYVACSMIFWLFISSLMNESCVTFIAAESQIKQVNQPASVYALRLLWRNMIIFFHNLLVIAVIIVVFKIYHWQLLIFPFVLMYVSIIGFFLCLTLGFLCARYRDIPQIIIAVTQVFMFITPIFWRKEFVTKHEWLMTFNPVFHILEIMRAPILGTPFPFESLFASFIILISLIISSIYLLARYRKRLAYWV